MNILRGFFFGLLDFKRADDEVDGIRSEKLIKGRHAVVWIYIGGI